MYTARYTIARYHKKYYTRWNAFVAGAKNASFLFHRDFMGYHKDRFEDFSLLVFKNDMLISVFPAHVVDTTVYSHQGLSYGGFLFDQRLKFTDCLAVVKHCLRYCFDLQLKMIQLKLIPKIYHRIPADEIDYLLFLLEAKLTKRTLSSSVVIGACHPSKNRREGFRRGQKNNLDIREEEDFSSFWNTILVPCLQNRFDAKPVHTLEEIHYLKQRFPKNIRQFSVYKENTIIAGTTVFESHRVARAQYIASNADKNLSGSLDFLYHYLIGTIYATKSYFDFGSSNQDHGHTINEGLLYWKQGYSNGTVVHDFYQIATEHYKRLNTVFV